MKKTVKDSETTGLEYSRYIHSRKLLYTAPYSTQYIKLTLHGNHIKKLWVQSIVDEISFRNATFKYLHNIYFSMMSICKEIKYVAICMGLTRFMGLQLNIILDPFISTA